MENRRKRSKLPRELLEMFIPGSGMASGAAQAMKMATGEDTSEDTLLQNIGRAAQRYGSYTVVPYMLKGAGYDDAADIMGYPFDDEGNKKPKYKAKKFKDGGQVVCGRAQVKGKGFKGTF
jgi:hypothetical protein